jgi:cytochrome c oxidase subunit 4
MSVDKHPNYWAVWAWLAILTFVEIFFAQIPWLSSGLILLGLVVMALVKAVLVAVYFMHFKFEGKALRLVILAPLPLTIPIILAVMTEYVW